MQDSITHEALEACTLADCPPGLFMFNGMMGFKSEYTTTLENPRRYQCDAYVVESGEYFHGGAKSTQDRAALIVTPLRTGQLSPSGDEVEAVARAVAEYQIGVGLPSDDAWEDAHGIATAAITTYEAVSGVAKMREALEDLRATPYPPVEDPDDTLGSMLDNQAWIVLSHVASRIGQRDGIEFMERWQDAWAEGEVQKGYFSPHRGVAAWIARHCQLTPEASAALGEKP